MALAGERLLGFACCRLAVVELQQRTRLGALPQLASVSVT
jgi:hypothetical protein